VLFCLAGAAVDQSRKAAGGGRFGPIARERRAAILARARCTAEEPQGRRRARGPRFGDATSRGATCDGGRDCPRPRCARPRSFARVARAQAGKELSRFPFKGLRGPLDARERAGVSRALRRLIAWQRNLQSWPSPGSAPDATPFVSLYVGGRLA